MPYKIEFDFSSCVGCGSCAIACMDQFDIRPKTETPFRRVFQHERIQNAHVALDFLSVACMHCEDASCMKNCPQQCFFQKENLVILDNQNCIGCKTCIRVCPLDAIGLQYGHKASKCNGCYERLALGLAPACVRACQNNAIRYEWTQEDISAQNSASLNILINLLKQPDAEGGQMKAGA